MLNRIFSIFRKRTKQQGKEISTIVDPKVIKVASLEPDKIYCIKVSDRAMNKAVDFMESVSDLLKEKNITILFLFDGMELYQIREARLSKKK